MKRGLCIAMSFAIALSIIAASESPASAASTCTVSRVNEDIPSWGYKRFCKHVYDVPGANLRGGTTWYIHHEGSTSSLDRTGIVAVIVKDTVADGSCAWLRYWFTQGQTTIEEVYASACGVGTTKGFDALPNFEGRYHDVGKFRLAVCSPKTECKAVWVQDVAETK